MVLKKVAWFLFVILFLSFFSGSAEAAVKYWVGGTGDWSDTNHWAASTGGGGGAGAPGSSDTATFDTNSGGGTATVDSSFAGIITTLNMASGNTTSVSLGRGLTVTTTFTLVAGNFDAAGQTLDVNGAFTFSGGTFTGGTTTTFNANVAISAGTFNAGTTVVFGDAGGDTFGLSGAGILNAGSGTVTFNATPTFSGGTFNGDSSTLDFNAAFTLSGGTFSASSGTTSFSNDFIHTAGGTFNHGNGTVVFDGGGATINVAASETFYNLTINGNNSSAKIVSPSDTLIVTNTLTLSEASVNQATIPAGGTINLQVDDGTEDLVVDANFDGGSGTLLITGNGSKTLSTLAAGQMIGINLNAANVTLNGPASGTLTLEGTINSLTIQAGTFNGGIGFITLNLGYTQSGGTFTGSSNPASGGLTVTGSFSLNGGTFNGGCYATFSSSVSASGGTMNGGDHAMTFNGVATFSGTAVSGGSADWDFNNTFTLSAGTFTASSGWSRFANDFTHTAGGTFSHGNGTVIFEGGSTTINVATSETFYNLTINGNHNTTKTVAVSDTLIVTNTLTLTEGSVNQATIPAGGTINLQVDDGTEDLVVNANFDGGTGILLISGNGSKTLSTLAGGRMMGITLNAANVTLNGPSSGTLTLEGTTNSLNIQVGTFNGGAGAITLNLAYNQSGGTFSGGAGTVMVTGAFNLSGGTFTGDAHTTLSTTASASGGTLNGGSAYGYLDFNGAATFSGATVNGQTGYFTFFSSFTLSSGSFTASSNNPIVFYGNFTHTAGGTFTPNNGLVYFAGSDTTIDVAGSETFYDVDVIQTTYLRLANGDTIVINGTLTLSNGAIIASGPAETATIDAKGTVSVESTFDGGYSTTQYLATLLIDGTGTQSVAIAAGAAMPKTTLNNSLATVSFSGAGTVTWEADFTLQAGTVTGGAPAITFNGTYTQSGGTFAGGAGTVTVTGVFSLGGGTFTGGTTTTLNGNMTISAGTFNGGTTVNFGNAAGDTFGFSGTGILNAGSGTVTFNATPTFSGGTFNGNSATLGFNTAFTLSGGTFTASSGTTSFAGAFTHTGGGSFSHNNGTAAFAGGATNIDVTTSETFYNLTINGTNGTIKTVANSDTLIVTNTLTLTEASVNQGTIPAGGTINLQVDDGTEDLVVAATFDGGTGTLLISGNGSKTLTTLAAGQMMGINLNAPNVTLTGPGSGTLTLEGTTNSLTIQAGTFNGGAAAVTLNLAYNQSGGTFTGGAGTVTVAGAFGMSNGTFTGGTTTTFSNTFTLSGGAFTASTGTTTFASTFTHTAGGTFDPNGGTAAFTGGSATIDVTTSETFSSVTINSTLTKTIADNDTLIVNGTLTLTNGSINQATVPATGTLAARGSITQESTFDGGTGLLLIDGDAPQTFTGNATTAAGTLPDVTIAKGGGSTLTLSGTIRTTNDWTYTTGTLDAGTSTVVFAGTLAVSGTHTLATVNLNGNAQNVTLASGVLSISTLTVGVAVDQSTSFTMNGTVTVSSAIYINRDFTIGGTGSLQAQNNLKITREGSNNSTTTTVNNGTTLSIAGDLTLGENDTSSGQGILSANGAVTVAGTLYLYQASITGTGSVAARGNITQTNNFQGGTGKIVIDGDAGQTLTGGGSGAQLVAIEINKSLGGTLTLSGTIGTRKNWTYLAGTLDAGSSTVAFGAGGTTTLTITGSHTLNNVTLYAPSGNVIVASGTTLNVSTPAIGLDLGESMTFTVDGSVVASGALGIYRNFTISGAGTLEVQNSVTIQNQSSSSASTVTVSQGTTFNIGGGLTITSADGSPEPNVTVNGMVVVSGTLTLQDGTINGTGMIKARGDITQAYVFAGGFGGGTGKILIDGTGPQTFTGGGQTTSGTLPDIEINKSDTLTLSSIIRTTNDWTYTAGTLDAGSSTVVFAGTLNVTGAHALNSVDIRGATTIAGGDLTVNGTLTLTSNNITTGSNTLVLGGSATISRTSGHVIGNLKKTYSTTESFTFTVGTANGYSPVDVNVTASPGDFTVKATQGCHPDIDTCNQALQRYWTLTASGPTADLTFHYLQGDVQGTEANYLISKYTIGSGWSFPAGSLDTVNNLASISGVSSFSDWTLAENRAPTSVRLASFTAGGYGDGVLIQWKTGYEVDNLGFHIYREVGSHRLRLTPELVAGSALLIGTGTPLTAGYSYNWWDPISGLPNPPPSMGRERVGGPVHYWLEDVDLNGKRTWHGPVEIQWLGVEGQGSYVSSQSSSEQKFSTLLSEGGKKSRSQTFRNPPPSREMAGVGLPSPEQLKKQWALAEKAGIKIGVKEAGWYRVRQPELVAAGLDPNINPRRLQLFVNGKERPILVAGEADGRFDPEDSIEFYGTGLDTPSTDTQVYWLAVGLRPGKRINPPRPSLEGEKEGLGRGRPVSFPLTIDSRERTFYFAALKNGDDENFFGPLITAEPVDRTLILQHLDPLAPEMASLEIGLQGMTAQPHHVRVLLNNVEVGDVSFDGQDHTIARIPFPQSGLLEGENLLTWVAENGETDVSLLDYLRLTYRHTYTADHDALRFTARGGDQLEIGGFGNSGIRVIDITRPKSLREITGVVEAAGDAYEIKVTIPGSGERELLAFTEDQIEQPALITANQPSGWHRKREKADLVIISHENFLESLTPLKTLREEQGYSVALIDVEDLYDEFSFGIKSPWAMKDFLTAAKKRWQRPPRYVLLVGDASFDPRNYLGLGEFDFVPTKQIDTAYLETASDDWFVDLNGDGLTEMAVGRLPVRTAEEAATVVSKIIGYEQTERGPWAGQALMVADRNHGFDFEGAIEEVGSLLPEQMTAWEIMVGRSDEVTARTALLTSIHEGQLVVNYMGHGSVEVWNGDLLTSDDAVSLGNEFRLPFFVIMTCLNGLFHDVYTESLSEALLKAPGGGALAVWASSGLTEPAWQVVINKELLRLLFEGKSLTLGEATKGAKAAVSDHDIRGTWILFGDPTTKLK